MINIKLRIMNIVMIHKIVKYFCLIVKCIAYYLYNPKDYNYKDKDETFCSETCNIYCNIFVILYFLTISKVEIGGLFDLSIN